ncbi:hypothetical protein [Thiomicrospira sp.]|uniref:hypothetical protein n=1 Tax=Thiomicrospira sp. TaxID=935 RepID=UPI002F95A3EF
MSDPTKEKKLNATFLKKVQKSGDDVKEDSNTDLEALEDVDLSEDIDDSRQDHEIKVLKQKLKELEDTHNLRLKFAWAIFSVVSAWLLAVGIILFFDGFGFSCFSLSENVLITVLTTTTINVIALLIIVANWLFPKGK